ncbi:MAG: hypothetical protein IJS62_09125 [Bacteroidales bacterium]|nr:hypothetical protein [Bacteroidales bacterium]
MKKVLITLLHYEVPSCFVFQNTPCGVLCGSFTTPDIVEEDGNFNWE